MVGTLAAIGCLLGEAPPLHVVDLDSTHIELQYTDLLKIKFNFIRCIDLILVYTLLISAFKLRDFSSKQLKLCLINC